jgi:hypothetical protein
LWLYLEPPRREIQVTTTFEQGFDFNRIVSVASMQSLEPGSLQIFALQIVFLQIVALRVVHFASCLFADCLQVVSLQVFAVARPLPARGDQTNRKQALVAALSGFCHASFVEGFNRLTGCSMVHGLAS